MTDLFTDFAVSYLAVLSFAIVAYVTGHFINSFHITNDRNPFKQFFIKLSTGLIVIVTIYAIYRTVFSTFYTGVLLTAILYFITNTKKFNSKISDRIRKVEPKVFACFLVWSLITTTIYVFLFHFDNRLFIHQDAAFYARLGSTLHKYGIEVTWVEAFMDGSVSKSIYHYFNEWLIAIFMGISNFPSLKIFLIIILPLLASISIAGAAALLKKLVSHYSYAQVTVLAFLIILLPGLLSFTIHLATKLNLNSPYSIFLGGIVILKVKIVVILLLLYFVNVKRDFKGTNFLPLVLIPLIWNTLIPVFFGGYILFTVYSILVKKLVSLKLFALWIFPIVYIPIYLFSANFNRNFNFDGNTKSVSSTYGLSNYLIDSYSSITPFVLTTIGMIVLALILYLFLLYFYDKVIFKFGNQFMFIKRLVKQHVILVASIILAGFISFSIMHDLFNARQILMNLLYPLFTILLLISYVKLYGYATKAAVLTVFGLILVFALHSYYFSPKDSWKKEVLSNKLKSLNQTQESFLVATDIAPNTNSFLLYHKPFADLLMFEESFKPIKFNVLNEENPVTPKERIESGGSRRQIFYRYMLKNDMFDRVDDAKVKFIHENKINFLIVSDSHYYNEKSYISRLKLDTSIKFTDNTYLLKLIQE